MSNALASLLSHPAIWRASRFHETQACAQQGRQGIPSGYTRLDRELPDSGWPAAGLTELLLPRDGQGELPLLAPALAQLSLQNRWLAWIAPPWVPYAPALARHGVQLERVLLIHPANTRDCLWAMEQCLSSGACAAVLGWPGKLQPQHIKRLHLAAQQGQCLGMLMREHRYAQEPSPAPLRVELGTGARIIGGQTQFNVRLLKRRGRWGSDWIPLHWQAPVAASWSVTPPMTVRDSTLSGAEIPLLPPHAHATDTLPTHPRPGKE